jgi:hypothetical protein
MDKRTILIQLDSDTHPSVFDRVVAVDAGADEVFSYGGVKPEHVRDLVHGAIFTRGGKTLRRTAIFIGGSDVAAGERLLDEVRKHLLPQFGLQVSVLIDANGANTTAAAAVIAASQHLDLRCTNALILGGTGPVGQRVARLLVRQGASVRLASRQKARSESACATILARNGNKARLEGVATGSEEELKKAVGGQHLIVAAGAAGIQLLPRAARAACNELRVAIDLNAVPPLGIDGIEVGDKAVLRDGVFSYGAIGVGASKMKIHKAAIAKLFENNNQILDAEEVFDLASTL